MKFNDRLYELAKSINEEDDIETNEEEEYEKIVIDMICDNINQNNYKDGLIKTNFSLKEYNILDDLVNNKRFNKLFNKYHIYIGNESNDYIEIIWDYKRYKEDLESEKMRSSILEYQNAKKKEECAKNGHDFGDWDFFKVVRKIIDENEESSYKEIDVSYYSRTCKRCGYIEREEKSPRVIVYNLGEYSRNRRLKLSNKKIINE